jgi:2-dehydropantoate 2-reductase
VAASTAADAVRGASVVLLCVKTLDTETAARSMAPHLAADAVVVSMQNGVDNVERIRSAAGIDAIPAVVYVGAQMAGPGWVKHTARGELVIGDLAKSNRRSDLDALVSLFTRAGVPCQISSNIEADLWTKMIINCSYNAMSALGRAKYHRLIGNTWTRDTMRQIVEEAVAVAEACGVRLPHNDMVQTAWSIGETMPQTISSTAQDIARGKRTEIDSLNGYVVRKGRELGIATPVNQTLHALVKLLEKNEPQAQPSP